MSELAIDVIHEREKWNTVLAAFPGHDFGHTFDFHAISSANGEGIPVMFAVRRGDSHYLACWPALKRHIADTSWCDLTSVYGYSGPLVADEDEAVEEALEWIYSEMANERVASLFARIHPFVVDATRLGNCRVEHVGNVVIMDTTHPPDRKLYRSNHRRDIIKAEAAGMTIQIDEECSNIEKFQELYVHTMQHLNAREYYFFNDRYFQGLIKSKEFATSLLMAEFQSQIIGGLLLVQTDDIMHYYLGGIHRNYLKMSPLKLLLAAAHDYAYKKNARTLVLGGGPGGLDDALLHFKRGFSDIVVPFYVCKKIINFPVYEKICKKRGVSSDGRDYFPPYRVLE